MATAPLAAQREEVPLTGFLAEFRTALRAEIDAASRDASSAAVPLVNGRRIAQVGGWFQYAFDIENPLNLPGDTPGDLHVPNRAPLAVSVISTEGSSITLSVSEDMGSFVPTARLQSNLTFLMRRLIERIEALADSPNPTGERIRGELPVSGKPADVYGLKVDGRPLEPEQHEAVASSLGRDTTLIWGPPGTGKTTTIGAIGVQLYRQERSVLLVSHTNIAVDQALLQIGQALDSGELGQGKVLRVGEPRDRRLQQQAELLLATHVERRSEELAQRREQLQTQRVEATEEILRASRAIEICEWVAEAEGQTSRMARELLEIDDIEVELRQARTELSRLEGSSGEWATVLQAARQAQVWLEEAAALEEAIAEMRHQESEARKALTELRSALTDAEHLLAQAEAIQPLRDRARLLPSLQVQTQWFEQARKEAALALRRHKQATALLKEAEDLYEETVPVGKLARFWKSLPPPEKQRAAVEVLRTRLLSASKQWEDARGVYVTAKRILAEITRVDGVLRKHPDVPELEAQGRLVDRLRRRAVDLEAEFRRATIALTDAEEQRPEIASKLDDFRHRQGAEPEQVVRRAQAHEAETKKAQSRADRLQHECTGRREHLRGLLIAQIARLRGWGLAAEQPDSIEEMVDALRSAYERATLVVAGLKVEGLRRQREWLNERVRDLEAEIEQIDEHLKRVGEVVIREATIVATTLTRAYLRDDIQARRFDTVILDEASMAPIPALWVAASLADTSAVVVGDFKQLPPIVISKHGLAKKWLGRDIFEVCNASGMDTSCAHRVDLTCQHRMHPLISAIPNSLVYEGRLRDAEGAGNGGSLKRWHDSDWGHDHPVLLVDTGSLGAWVTSVPSGARYSSRLNFLSATVCVDLAEQLLRADRTKVEAGGEARILIVCPYRAHAKLLGLLLKENGLADEVWAGTAHSFQGSEADAVILDLVNDEPHWKVGMFMRDNDESMKRLLNVALTRARHRLIVVGDFEYVVKHARKAFIGKELVPFLQKHYPQVEARDVVPAGLAARAAEAHLRAFGGNVEPDEARLVVNHGEQFYTLLRGDLERASTRVVIYSPFITADRLSQLQLEIRSAAERGVTVYVVTKTLGERHKGQMSSYRRLERALADWGVVVVHKRHMHEKLVFIDDEILWSGSLNPLSFRDTQEVMERRASREVFEDFAKGLRLRNLISAYDDGQPKCPVCGWEQSASEGRDKPFYWRCTNPECNYTRDIDQPPLEGGVIRCFNCGAPVEYGEWGGKPAWRCTENRHHHQKVARTHLLLPKTRVLVPTSELRKLDRRFGISPSIPPPMSAPRQGGLFDSEG